MSRLFIFFLFLSTASFGQDAIELLRFRASNIEGGVHITWTLGPGNVCLGTQLYRTTDTTSSNFVLIEDIEGVCGDQNYSVDYQYTDYSTPNTSELYYQLSLGGWPSRVIRVEPWNSVEPFELNRENNMIQLSIAPYALGDYKLTIYTLSGESLMDIPSISPGEKLWFRANQSGLIILILQSSSGERWVEKLLI